MRKTAHATEYAILGLLAAGVYLPGSLKQKNEKELTEKKESGRYMNGGATEICRELLIPWAIAAAYAATDEFHQLFVPGRSGQFSDVVLDSAGVLAGLLILAAVRKIRGRQHNKTEILI